MKSPYSMDISYSDEKISFNGKFWGKTISEIKFSLYAYDDKEYGGTGKEGEYLWIGFSDGSGIKITDHGGQCCEQRFMTCDDELTDIVGGQLITIDQKTGPEVEDHGSDDTHESQFVDIITSKGIITLTNHNVHNGYYSGFDMEIEEVK